MTDSERLDWLEAMANNEHGLLLHSSTKPTHRLGLGLGCTGRTLREAIDGAAGDASETGGKDG